MSLFDDVRNEAAHLLKEFDPEFHMIAALVWRDAKQVAASELSARDLSALKDAAAQVVAATENDPTFKNAVGSWKQGHACMMLMSKLGSGTLSNVPKLGQDTVETLIQSAFASMVTHS